MRTWKVNFVPFWRIGDVLVGWLALVGWVVDDDVGAGVGSGSGAEAEAEVVGDGGGWERMVTRGTKEFQLGQVEVSVRAAQTCAEGALMMAELPMCRVAFAGVMVGVARVAFVGSVRVVMVIFVYWELVGDGLGLRWRLGRDGG